MFYRGITGVVFVYFFRTRTLALQFAPNPPQ